MLCAKFIVLGIWTSVMTCLAYLGMCINAASQQGPCYAWGGGLLFGASWLNFPASLDLTASCAQRACRGKASSMELPLLQGPRLSLLILRVVQIGMQVAASRPPQSQQRSVAVSVITLALLQGPSLCWLSFQAQETGMHVCVCHHFEKTAPVSVYCSEHTPRISFINPLTP